MTRVRIPPRSPTTPAPTADLTEIDRIRIHDDLDQLNELVARKQALWEAETRSEVKEVLAQELEQASGDIALLNARLA